MSAFEGTLEDFKADDPFLRATHGHSGARPETAEQFPEQEGALKSPNIFK